MNDDPAPRVLIAGLGNENGTDDAFGVEVARRLVARPLPAGVQVMEAGLRNLRLARELVDRDFEALILVDALVGDAWPGALHVVAVDRPRSLEGIDPHATRAEQIVDMARMLGSRIQQAWVIGCEPACRDDGVGMSPAVAATVDAAADAALLLATELAAQPRAVSVAGRATAAHDPVMPITRPNDRQPATGGWAAAPH